MEELPMKFGVSRRMPDSSRRVSEDNPLYFETAPASHGMGSPGEGEKRSFSGATPQTPESANNPFYFYTTPQKQRASSMQYPYHPSGPQASSPESRNDDGSCTPSQRLLFLNSPAATTQPQPQLCLSSPSMDDHSSSLNGESPSNPRQPSSAIPPSAFLHLLGGRAASTGGVEMAALEDLQQRPGPQSTSSSPPSQRVLTEDRRLSAAHDGTSPSPTPLSPAKDNFHPFRRPGPMPCFSSSSLPPEATSRTVSPSPLPLGGIRESGLFQPPQLLEPLSFSTNPSQQHATQSHSHSPSVSSHPPNASGGLNLEEGESEAMMWRQHAACMDSDEEEDRRAPVSAFHTPQSQPSHLLSGERLSVGQAQSLPPPPSQGLAAAAFPSLMYPTLGLTKEEQDRLNLEAFQRSHLGPLAAYDADDNPSAMNAGMHFNAQQAYLNALLAAMMDASKSGMPPPAPGNGEPSFNPNANPEQWQPAASHGFPANLFSAPAPAQGVPHSHTPNPSIEDEQHHLLMHLQAATLNRQKSVSPSMTTFSPPGYTASLSQPRESSLHSVPGAVGSSSDGSHRSPPPPSHGDPNQQPSEHLLASQNQNPNQRRKPQAPMTTAVLQQQRYSATTCTGHPPTSTGVSQPQRGRHSPLCSPLSPSQGGEGSHSLPPAAADSRGNSPLSSISSVSQQGLPPPPTNRSSFHAKLKAAAGSLIAVGGRRVPVDKLHHLLANGAEEGEEGDEGEDGETHGPSSRRAPGKAVRIVKMTTSPSNASHSGAFRESSTATNHNFRPSVIRESSAASSASQHTLTGNNRNHNSGGARSDPHNKSCLPPPPTYLKHHFQEPTARPPARGYDDSSASVSPMSASSHHASEAIQHAAHSNDTSSPMVVLRFQRGEVMNFRVPKALSGNPQKYDNGSNHFLATAAPRCEVGKTYLAYIRGIASPFGSFGFCDVGCCIQVVPQNKNTGREDHLTIHGNVIRRVDSNQNPEEAVHQSELRHSEATVYQETLNRIQLLNLPVQLESVHITHDQKICVLYVHCLATTPGSHHNNNNSFQGKRNKESAVKALQKDVQRFVDYTVCVKAA